MNQHCSSYSTGKATHKFTSSSLLKAVSNLSLSIHVCLRLPRQPDPRQIGSIIFSGIDVAHVDVPVVRNSVAQPHPADAFFAVVIDIPHVEEVLQHLSRRPRPVGSGLKSRLALGFVRENRVATFSVRLL